MLEPLSPSQWNESTAAHLLYRAGFGGCPEDIKKLTNLGLDRAVSWFVDYEKIPDNTPNPDWAHADPEALDKLKAIRNATDLEMKKELLRQRRMTDFRHMGDLRYWWIQRMALGPRPLQERMTLFWHGHFATSFEKVRSPFLLWQQNDIFRQNAMGTFYDLLVAVSKDPAMLVYLDGATSRKGHPNENFAREVMELFTLGEGHYTEKDIQESARAYTGWTLTRDRQHFRFDAYNHDEGMKEYLKRRGNFTGEDCLRILCEQTQTSRYIAWKLWKFFAQDNPPPKIVEALAQVLASSNMNIKHAVSTMFRSHEFYGPEVMNNQIKSPVTWLIGAMRELQGSMPTMPMSLVILNSLGQELFQPPNVKGWDGGVSWITTNSLLSRYNFAASLVEGDRVLLPSLNNQMKAIMRQMENQGLLQIPPADVKSLFAPEELSSPDLMLQSLQSRFLHRDMDAKRFEVIRNFVHQKAPLSETDLRKVIRLLMSTPDYQLC